MKGRLFVLEGPDEVGKTTLGTMLLHALVRQGHQVELLSFPGREEGSLGALVYKLHHEPTEFGISRINESSRQILHVAAHADLITRTLIPCLDEGKVVILDRFWWSTLVYGQVGGMRQDVLDALLALENALWSSYLPSALVLIDRDAPFVEVENLDEWHQLRDAYLELAHSSHHDYPVHILPNVSTPSAASSKLTHILDTAI